MLLTRSDPACEQLANLMLKWKQSVRPSTGALGGGFLWPLGTPPPPWPHPQNYCTSVCGSSSFQWLEKDHVEEPEVKVLLNLSTVKIINHPAYGRISGIQRCLLLLPYTPPPPLFLALCKWTDFFEENFSFRVSFSLLPFIIFLLNYPAVTTSSLQMWCGRGFI